MGRQQKEKNRILKRIMNINLRYEGMAFRQAIRWMEADRDREIALIRKQRGVMMRILDSNTRLMGMGWNKLLEGAKARKGMLQNKLRFVIKALTDQDAHSVLSAYNQLKQRCLMLMGVGMGDAQMKKVSLIKRMMNKGHNLQIMAINSIKQFLHHSKDDEEKAKCELERQEKERSRILRRIMNTNLRFEGMAFRQAFQFMEADREREIVRVTKQRGVMMRILDSNTRLISAGWNKLLEEAKARKSMLKNKLRYVLKSLTDKDSAMTLAAYNELKQRRLMLMGVGMGDAEMKKINLIKRITNKSRNLQAMGVNALKNFLAWARDHEEKLRQETERQQKEKIRILKRIMNINLRFEGMAFRQAIRWMEADRDREIALIRKQRGVMMRILDSNTRLMGMGWNKLLEGAKARKGMLQNKLRFVIKALTDQDAHSVLSAYNQLKQRCLMLMGVGMGDAQMKKVSLIKRMMNKGHNLQIMALNSIKQF